MISVKVSKHNIFFQIDMHSYSYQQCIYLMFYKINNMSTASSYIYLFSLTYVLL